MQEVVDCVVFRIRSRFWYRLCISIFLHSLHFPYETKNVLFWAYLTCATAWNVSLPVGDARGIRFFERSVSGTNALVSSPNVYFQTRIPLFSTKHSELGCSTCTAAFLQYFLRFCLSIDSFSLRSVSSDGSSVPRSKRSFFLGVVDASMTFWPLTCSCITSMGNSTSRRAWSSPLIYRRANASTVTFQLLCAVFRPFEVRRSRIPRVVGAIAQVCRFRCYLTITLRKF